jgi:hypothetical protein
MPATATDAEAPPVAAATGSTVTKPRVAKQATRSEAGGAGPVRTGLSGGLAKLQKRLHELRAARQAAESGLPPPQRAALLASRGAEPPEPPLGAAAVGCVQAGPAAGGEAREPLAPGEVPGVGEGSQVPAAALVPAGALQDGGAAVEAVDGGGLGQCAKGVAPEAPLETPQPTPLQPSPSQPPLPQPRPAQAQPQAAPAPPPMSQHLATIHGISAELSAPGLPLDIAAAAETLRQLRARADALFASLVPDGDTRPYALPLHSSPRSPAVASWPGAPQLPWHGGAVGGGGQSPGRVASAGGAWTGRASRGERAGGVAGGLSEEHTGSWGWRVRPAAEPELPTASDGGRGGPAAEAGCSPAMAAASGAWLGVAAATDAAAGAAWRRPDGQAFAAVKTDERGLADNPASWEGAASSAAGSAVERAAGEAACAEPQAQGEVAFWQLGLEHQGAVGSRDEGSWAGSYAGLYLESRERAAGTEQASGGEQEGDVSSDRDDATGSLAETAGRTEAADPHSASVADDEEEVAFVGGPSSHAISCDEAAAEVRQANGGAACSSAHSSTGSRACGSAAVDCAAQHLAHVEHHRHQQRGQAASLSSAAQVPSARGVASDAEMSSAPAAAARAASAGAGAEGCGECALLRRRNAALLAVLARGRDAEEVLRRAKYEHQLEVRFVRLGCTTGLYGRLARQAWVEGGT